MSARDGRGRRFVVRPAVEPAPTDQRGRGASARNWSNQFAPTLQRQSPASPQRQPGGSPQLASALLDSRISLGMKKLQQYCLFVIASRPNPARYRTRTLNPAPSLRAKRCSPWLQGSWIAALLAQAAFIGGRSPKLIESFLPRAEAALAIVARGTEG